MEDDEMNDSFNHNSYSGLFNQKQSNTIFKPHLTMRCCARKSSMSQYHNFLQDTHLLCYRTIERERAEGNQSNTASAIYQRESNDEEIREKEKPRLNSCLLCNWVFPSEMINQERNTHIMQCAEGNGKEDIVNYLSSKARVLLAANRPNRVIEGTHCIFCKKKYKVAKTTHLDYCAKKYLSIHKKT